MKTLLLLTLALSACETEAPPRPLTLPACVAQCFGAEFREICEDDCFDLFDAGIKERRNELP
mgnify:CR=1 FL=1